MQLLVVDRNTLLATVGGLLYLFAGPGIVLALAVTVLRRGTSWLRPALVAAAGVWTLTRSGSFMNDGIPGGHEIGFWLMVVGVPLALVGALKVAATGRARPGRASPGGA